MNGAGGHKKTEKSKSPHAKPAYGAPKFVLGLVVRATGHQLSPAGGFWQQWHVLEVIAGIAGKLTRGMNSLTPPGATPEWAPAPRFL
jgi:hypothetical protein